MNAFHLHLLRHGAPETPGLLLGRTDAAPDRDGIAACVAQLDGLPFDRLITSDLRRAADAADSIGAVSGVVPVRDPRWRELDFGAWDGLAPADIDAARLSAFWNDPDANAPPDGERWSALVMRVRAAIAGLPAEDTLVVTHGGAMRAALAVLFGFDRRQLWAFHFSYAAFLSLRIWPGEPRSAEIIGLWP